MQLKNTWLHKKGQRDIVGSKADLVKKKSYLLALNATLWCSTLILHSAETTKGFGSVLYKDKAGYNMKDKLERKENGGREIWPRGCFVVVQAREKT